MELIPAVQRRDLLTLGLTSLAALRLPSAANAVEAPALGRTAPAAAALPMMAARPADAVCDAYMVNTKLFYSGRVYEHTDAVVDLLKELGVRIVRERVTTGTSRGSRNQRRAMIELADAGVRWHGTVGGLADWRQATEVNRAVMRHLESYYKPRVGGDLSALMHSFGGCNEIDGAVLNGKNDPEWAEHARIMQKALWRAAKGNSATRGIPVAGPSTRTDVTRTRARELGDLGAFCDLGNAHMYNGGTSPTRNIDAHLDILSECFPDPDGWIFTETGYSNSPQDNANRSVPESASATYVPRGICDFFKRRAVYGRFELLDDPDAIDYTNQTTINRTADRNAHFGLVAMAEDTVRDADPRTWRKKPEFYATKRFLSLMSDRGRSFTPDGMRLELSGGGRDLQHQLVQKRNGTHYLLLWRDVEVAKPYPDGDSIRVDPVRVTVRMGTERPTAVYEPRRSDRPEATYSARSSLDVRVAGDLLVVEIG